MTLKEISEEITRKFNSKRAEAEALRAQYNKERLESYEEYRVASSFGDRRENAMLDAAVEKMNIINSKIIVNEKRLSQMGIMDDLSLYNSVGIVVLYSTVRFTCDGHEFIYKIYPGELSYLDIGIMAETSRVAQALMGHVVGDVVGVDHSARSETLNYKIEEIY